MGARLKRYTLKQENTGYTTAVGITASNMHTKAIDGHIIKTAYVFF
jgi:hypothetical protein